jgi:hypothetical protein
MSKVIHMRTVTVQPFVIPSRHGKPERVKPFIRLMGNWLKCAGFEPWMSVIITVNDGVLTIKPAEGRNAKMRA